MVIMPDTDKELKVGRHIFALRLQLRVVIHKVLWHMSDCRPTAMPIEDTDRHTINDRSAVSEKLLGLSSADYPNIFVPRKSGILVFFPRKDFQPFRINARRIGDRVGSIRYNVHDSFEDVKSIEYRPT